MTHEGASPGRSFRECAPTPGYWMEAEDAVTSGSLLHAIDVLTEANRRSPDARREQRLVQLRHDAVGELVGPGREPWPPDLPDPFATAGLPEIEAAELSVDRVGGGILHHGAVLVRGLVDACGVQRLVECIDRSLESVAAKRAGRMTAEHETWFTPFGRRELALGQGTEWLRVIDSPRGTFEVVEALQGVNRTFITPYLGQRPVMGSYKWTLRRITPDCVGEWHQDGRVLGDVRVANVWIALARCGGDTDAPGLEVVPQRLDGYLVSGTDGAVLDFSIGQSRLEARVAAAIADPVYEPGDALIFDERTAHRTGSRPGLTSVRHSIEAWFFSPSAYPEAQTAFVF